MIYYYNFVLIMLIFVACVASMFHLRFMQWLGAFDMNTILTTYASMAFGLPAGLFVANASIVGLIINGDVDNNILFDFAASYVVAIVASFFTLVNFVPVVVSLASAYFIGYMLYHYTFGTFAFSNVCWGTTNFLWVLFVVYKLIPLIF